jgi:cytochrome c-type biogenesis protein CcmH
MKLFMLREDLKLLAILLFTLIPVQAYAAIDNYTFADPKQEQLFYDLSKQLRCPKCQNQNIADSNSQLAQDLRRKTYELVKQGKSEQQVIDYMVARFGNFVSYDPPLTPATLFLWLGPLAFVLFGFYFLLSQIKRQNKVDSRLGKHETKRLQKILGSSNSGTKQETKR